MEEGRAHRIVIATKDDFVAIASVGLLQCDGMSGADEVVFVTVTEKGGNKRFLSSLDVVEFPVDEMEKGQSRVGRSGKVKGGLESGIFEGGE